MRAVALTFAVVVATALGSWVPSAAAACGAAGTPTTTVYLPNITKTLGGPSGWVTPFIVQNVGASATTLEVSLYRFSDGSLVTCRGVPGLLPGTSFADVPNNDTDLPDNAQFAVVVRSFGSEVVSVVNEHQGSGTRAEALSYVGLSQGRSGIYLPYVAKALGGWTTTFVMQNLGTADARVSIAFVTSDGTRTSLSRTIGPGRSAFVDPTAEPTIAAGLEYAVTLSSDQPIAAIANAHNDAPTAAQPMGFSYNGVGDAAGQPVSLAYVARETDGIGRTTRVLVQNIGTADATPTLAFRSSTGEQVTIGPPAPVKPQRTWSFDPRKKADGVTACPATPAGGCVSMGEHALVVSGGSFAVLGITLSPATAMGAVGGRATSTRIYLPNITRTLGGTSGWTTPIVLQREGGLDTVASSSTATLRWYRFSDGSLQVTQYVSGLAVGGSVKIDPRSVPGLADDTQYAVVIDAPGRAVATVLELNSLGGDAAMAYEGFYATAAAPSGPAPTTLAVAPATAIVSIGGMQQFTATARDQAGNAFTGVPIAWSVSPATAGTVSAAGLFTAGSAATSATVTATFGALSGTAAVTVAQTTVTTGGFTFTLRATATSDVYVERTITTADADAIATTVDADVAQIQKDYARTFQARPQAYVFPTTAAYTTGLETVMGLPPADAVATGAKSCGLFRSTSAMKSVALNWAEVKRDLPYRCPRHELTHAMIEEIVKPGIANPVPAWVNEGNARLEEFTIARTAWWKNWNRYGAASMVAVRQYFTVAQITDQDEWRARSGAPLEYEYYEASQVAQLVRDDVGMTGMVRMLELMGQGQTFDAAYASVAGRTLATFSASVPTRLQAISAAYPYAVTSTDEPGGNTGLSYILYGFQPGSTITLDIRGVTTGNRNTERLWTTDAYGVISHSLGSTWPADTYEFTVSGTTPPSSTTPGTSVTFTISAVKSASADVLTLTR